MLMTIPSSSRFVVADHCHANGLTISHPAVAEHEREASSERTTPGYPQTPTGAVKADARPARRMRPRPLGRNRILRSRWCV
jgi:hypothetical protein